MIELYVYISSLDSKRIQPAWMKAFDRAETIKQSKSHKHFHTIKFEAAQSIKSSDFTVWLKRQSQRNLEPVFCLQRGGSSPFNQSVVWLFSTWNKDTGEKRTAAGCQNNADNGRPPRSECCAVIDHGQQCVSQPLTRGPSSGPAPTPCFPQHDKADAKRQTRW